MKVNIFWPFMTFFAAGEARLGMLALAMQLSLVFWPAAVARARDFLEARGVQRMLDELSLAHQTDEPKPTKRFKQSR